MSTEKHDEHFVRHLTGCQPGVYAYILTLLPDANQAADVLQETNVELWRNADRFTPGTNFMAWACKVAYFQVLAHRKRHIRDPLHFDESLLNDLAQRLDNRASAVDERLVAVRHCLAKLPERQRHLLHQRYAGSDTIEAIAQRSGRPVKTLYQMLYRARCSLLGCIRATLDHAAAAESDA